MLTITSENFPLLNRMTELFRKDVEEKNYTNRIVTFPISVSVSHQPLVHRVELLLSRYSSDLEKLSRCSDFSEAEVCGFDLTDQDCEDWGELSLWLLGWPSCLSN